MTLFFASHTIIIKRARAQGSNKYTYSATFTAYQADIQPAGPQRTEQVSGRVGLTYEAWMDPSVPVREGDVLISSGTRYNVKAVETYQGAGLLDSKHLILVSQDNA